MLARYYNNTEFHCANQFNHRGWCHSDISVDDPVVHIRNYSWTQFHSIPCLNDRLSKNAECTFQENDTSFYSGGSMISTSNGCHTSIFLPKFVKYSRRERHPLDPPLYWTRNCIWHTDPHCIGRKFTLDQIFSRRYSYSAFQNSLC